MVTKKKVNIIPNDYVVVEFIKSRTPYVKGDITAIPKKEYAYLKKFDVVIKL